jgi:hypothetical protein
MPVLAAAGLDVAAALAAVCTAGLPATTQTSLRLFTRV